MDILISTLEVIITDYAEATEGSVVNGGVDDVITLPTVLYLSSNRCSLCVAFRLFRGTLYFQWWILKVSKGFLGSCDRASWAKYEDRKTNKMQQLDVYY